jgi:CheY-like chemotaxis protein
MAPLLIVDDSDDDLFFARRAYAMTGQAPPLVCLHSGECMLDYQHKVREGEYAQPFAILLDINMPMLDGFAAFSALARMSGGQVPVPVWFLTGSDDPSDVRVAASLGARGLITKPDSVRELARILNDVLLAVGGGT